MCCIPSTYASGKLFPISYKITLDNMLEIGIIIIEVWFSSLLNRLEITSKFNNFHIIAFSKMSYIIENIQTFYFGRVKVAPKKG